MISFIPQNELRNLIENYVNTFPIVTNQALKSMRKCYVHGDMSDTNIVVAKDSNNDYDVTALIDFEDVHYGYLVGDLGICVAYMMGRGGTFKCEPNKIAQLVLKSYESSCPIEEHEKVYIYDSVVARAITSYAMGKFLSSKKCNTDDESLSVQSETFPTILKLLLNQGRTNSFNLWFDV